jgi:hypothetical protein
MDSDLTWYGKSSLVGKVAQVSEGRISCDFVWEELRVGLNRRLLTIMESSEYWYRNPEREPCESTIIRFFNDLRNCEERLIPQKSYKSLLCAGQKCG